MLNETYELRKKGETIWFDAEKEAFEYFWDFDAFNTRLMNGKLRTQAALLGKARENAIRLAIIFAHAEGSSRITADIAKRACRVVSYSICVSVVLFSSGMLPEIVKKGKGRYVVLKERLVETQKALGIVPDDDDMPF